MTFSIVARATAPGELARAPALYGIALASSAPAVAARCAHARAAAGAVASQNIADPALGSRILDALQQGGGAADALGIGLRSTPYSEYRQMLVIGRDGPPAAHSGAHALGIHATTLGTDAAAAGNRLANVGVPAAMLRAFEQSGGALAERLLQALRAGLAAGGEAATVHSAGLVVVRDVTWPIIDLRVDWDDADPVGTLEALYVRYAPHIEADVQRAVNPVRAPRYGAGEP